MRGFEPPTAGTQKIEIEQSQALAEISASDDHDGSAGISGIGCEPATDDEALAEVLILPALPLPPLVHVAKLAVIALLMLEGGRVEPAKGVLRAIQKVLAKSCEALPSDEPRACLDASRTRP